MDKFSLDDVRDSFGSDIAAQIRALGASARTLTESVALDWRPESDGQPEFAAIGRCCHTIYGTSSLVGVKSLYESARLLHIVGNLGEENLREVEDRLKLVRALIVIARHGAQSLGSMLELELDNRGDDAWAEALRLREELSGWQDARQALDERRAREDALPHAARDAHAVRPEPPPLPPSDPAGEFDFGDGEEKQEMRAPEPVARAAEFSFDEEPAAESAPVESPVMPSAPSAAPLEYSFPDAPESPSAELREVFQQEAREYLVVLQGYLQALSRDGSDAASAASLERIYHTLKGSAATVGLSEVSAQAGELQDIVEETMAQGQPFGPALLARIVERTDRLLAAGGLTQLRLDAAPFEPASPSPELQRLFWEDAAGVLVQLHESVALLETDPDPGARVEILRGLFHRLKGSSVVASERALAEAAGRLQDLCESGAAAAHPEELRRGLARLERLLTPGQTPLPPIDSRREAVTLDMDPVILEAFEIEVGELLEAMDRSIFALESSQTPKMEISALFRHYHTLKGSVNTVGLAGLGRLVHRLEDYLEELQDAPILPPLASLATLLLNVQDELRRNLRYAKRGFVEVDVPALESEIARLKSGETAASRGSRLPAPGASEISGRSDSGIRPSSSRRERVADTGAVERKFVRVSTERLDGLMNLTGELVVSRSRLARRVTALQGMHRELTLERHRLNRAVDRFRENYEFETVAGGYRTGASARTVDRAGTAVAFSDLELDRYGDINILARTLADIGHDISQVQGRMTDSLGAFSEDAAGFGAIVAGLQVEITQARMVPVQQLFVRLRLPVRDAGEREGKTVRVQMYGEDVDLDKAILDELYNPMLHLVRNAVAHGLESPAARRAAGKEDVGTISLSARQETGELILEVQDDGAGLDYLRLYDVAVARGLVAPDTPADSPEVADTVFVSGVTTRDDVDEVSGRGLGCDVVRREVERLGGHIRVSSLRGLGTTFTLHLPLTLAITRALVVRHRGQSYAVTLSLAERIVDLEEASVHESAGVRRLSVDGVYHTLRSLDALFGLPARGEGEGTARAAVLLRVGQNRLALEVDRIVGQEEIVVKGLGDVLSGHALFSGVTVSGDGELILILDVLGLLQKDRRVSADVDVAAVVDARATGARVLFVDDSLSVRKVAERFLNVLGARITLAADGQEALETLRSGERFDIVFTDLEMPRLHGYDLVREIRATPSLRDLPVVVVTSRSGPKHRDQATAVGATDFITKPFNQDLLGSMIRRWVPKEPAS